jgi:hypothetical protein
MSWLPPLPKSAVDESGRWQIRRVWPDRTQGDYYKLDVTATGEPGARAACLRSWHVDLVPRDGPGLVALLAEARPGAITAHRPHTRAVVRAAACHIKVFRTGEATVPAERCAHTGILLGGGPFGAPRVLQKIAIDGASALGLLDFDDTAPVGAALDLGSLNMHLAFLAGQERLRPARYLTAHWQVMAAADRLRISPDRFRACSEAVWMRLACSPPGRLSLALAALDDRASRPPVRHAQELMA